jgi:hypothetical protein
MTHETSHVIAEATSEFRLPRARAHHSSRVWRQAMQGTSWWQERITDETSVLWEYLALERYWGHGAWPMRLQLPPLAEPEPFPEQLCDLLDHGSGPVLVELDLDPRDETSGSPSLELPDFDAWVPVLDDTPCLAWYRHDRGPGGAITTMLKTWQRLVGRVAGILPGGVAWTTTIRRPATPPAEFPGGGSANSSTSYQDDCCCPRNFMLGPARRPRSLLVASYLGRSPAALVRARFRLLVMVLRAVLSRVFRQQVAILAPEGARQSPGRRLSARPRVPRGPTPAGRPQPSSRGVLALA